MSNIHITFKDEHDYPLGTWDTDHPPMVGDTVLLASNDKYITDRFVITGREWASAFEMVARVEAKD